MADDSVYPGLMLSCDNELAEELSFDLSDFGAVAVETRDATTMSKATDDRVLLIAGFATEDIRSAALNELSQMYPTVEVSTVEIRDDGWSTGWQAFFSPVVLSKIQIVTPWMTPPRPDLETVVIDPGQAFGTGGHATTVMLLQMLEDRAKAGGLPARVFDVGIGSGILSIAAVKLGAGEAEGIDVEEPAVVAVGENAERNQVQDRVRAWLGTADLVSGSWELVLANIQLAVFETCAADIARMVAPGGEALLSGLLTDQVDACIALWPGFEVKEIRREKEWAAIALVRSK